VVKNSLANYAFEHYEIASYKALLEMADAAGDGQAPALLRQSLDEEVRMAQWIDQHLPETIRTYMRLESAGQKSGV
jgi:ferritin-like metal-binding protein YciE